MNKSPAWRELYSDFSAGILMMHPVQTPGYSKREMPPLEVLAERIEDKLPQLQALLAVACESGDQAVRICAQALVIGMAAAHADFHESDAVDPDAWRDAEDEARPYFTPNHQKVL